MSPDSAVGWLLAFVDGGRREVSPLVAWPLGVPFEVPSPLVGGLLDRCPLNVPSRVEMKVMSGSLSSECRLQAGRKDRAQLSN